MQNASDVVDRARRPPTRRFDLVHSRVSGRGHRAQHGSVPGREVFAENGGDRISSADLVAALVAMADKPWGECNHWTGASASKARLMGLKSPPRVLHLATHGFYLPREEQEREPMLFSGIALAGANRTLAGKGDDGILLALEAQGLNLEGSELVLLSACDTAKGSPDYSEGLYGLARAFRTAGARNVMVTLWPLNDGEARDFMKEFYRNWLSQVRSDPAKALRDTQNSYLKKDDPALRDPRVWAPYILIE
jgi:hypothetical protein